uniref:Uncharacterized protein n=1 Tax=Oryzias latipes TaxID=8090 RepID=A0A286P9S8_ORYLA|nr:hypothetical protein [Oryzias latipes]
MRQINEQKKKVGVVFKLNLSSQVDPGLDGMCATGPSEPQLVVELEGSDAPVLLEYTWVQLYEIEKRLPSSVTLTGPKLGGPVFIPVGPGALRGARCMVLRVVYSQGSESYGLVTDRHFRAAKGHAKGYPVKRISVLASAPLAWVELRHSEHYDTAEPGASLACGHGTDKAEKLVSSIYTSLNRFSYYTVAASRDGDLSERERVAREVTVATLATLGAPLAFKILHEQSRLTVARAALRTDGRASDSSWLPDPTQAVWGTSVLWRREGDADPGALSRWVVNSPLRPPSPPSSGVWLLAHLTRSGIEVVEPEGPDVISADRQVRAPYWAVVLTALCCGALSRWSRELDLLSRELRSAGISWGRICQRCGFANGVCPSACEPAALRTLAVSQIDGLLLGKICTTLCATVPAQGGRLCLNHRRTFGVSAEELREGGRHGGGLEGSRGDEPRSEAKELHRRAEAEEEPDAGWWIWQKRARLELREKVLGRSVGEDPSYLRLWSSYYSNGRADELRAQLGGASLSSDYWKGLSCGVLGYHIGTCPFGLYCDLLDIEDRSRRLSRPPVDEEQLFGGSP